MNRINRNIAWTLGFVALVANPTFACSSSAEDDGYTFDERDMRNVVVGTWEGTLTYAGQEEGFVMTLEQSTTGQQTQPLNAEPGLRPLCGTRSFVAPAAACGNTTTMPLVGTLTSDGGTFTDVPFRGEMSVWGNNLSYADLHIQLDDSSGSVAWSWNEESGFAGGSINLPDGTTGDIVFTGRQ